MPLSTPWWGQKILQIQRQITLRSLARDGSIEPFAWPKPRFERSADMTSDMEREIAGLESMTTSALVARYKELLGHDTASRHRQYMIRKIAWRMQALAEGDLSERARRRAAELANDADVRVMPPRRSPGNAVHATVARVVDVPAANDPRLPPPGSFIERRYKGQRLRVRVSPEGNGFEYEGERYRTLTAVAKAITGSHINGFRFFKLEAN
jgi:Protein of unknown function (DUF2924)